MKKGAAYTGALVLLLLIAGSARAGKIELTFAVDSLQQTGSYHYSYPGLKNINFNESLSLPVKTLYIKGEISPEAGIVVTSDKDSDIILNTIPAQIRASRDIRTDLDSPEKSFSRSDILRFDNGLFNVQRLRQGNKNITSVSVMPLTLDSSGRLIFHRKITIETVGSALSTPLKNILFTPSDISTGAHKSNESTFGIPLYIDMVIITSPELVEVYNRLAEYKNSIGIATAIAVTDSIYSHYSGEDNPARIRSYLMDFYNTGGEYVLLGGDDINLPPRYLYYYNTSSVITDPYTVMPSDLYYADLNGIWDKDGDGVYGEPNDDEPDIIPELQVGRIPLRNTEAIDNYIDKVIGYETDPGGGDFSYLNRQLYFCSDQMRDYPDSGQHNYIAKSLPSFVEVDSNQTVELPDGYDSNPSNPDGNFGVEKISEGFGFIQIISHGRVDGFRVKAAHYGDWPASNILTLPISEYHGCLDNLEQNDKTSLYYSLSCQVGGYDLDSLDHQSADISFIERILGAPHSGAVAMIANTRWGWVYSSYFLQEAFTRHLYDDADGNAVAAMNLSWLDYSYYRDLIYGQNYYGDPSITIYLDEPQKMEADAWPTDDMHRVYVSTSGSKPVANAEVIVSLDGVAVEAGVTDNSGIYDVRADLDYGTAYTVNAIHDGFNIARISYMPSLVTDTEDDDQSNLPDYFSVAQNYPNPFNPTTTIAYDLPERRNVNIEIYNILGQIVYYERVYNQEPGTHEITWAGKDEYGRDLPSGIYLYRIEAGDLSQKRKMMLLK